VAGTSTSVGTYRVGAVCRELGVSAAYFRELFLRDVGQTPKEWMRTERMMVARRLLEGGMRSPEVAEAVGFSKSESFAREFRQLHGMPPVIFLKSHPKEHV
jgi:AraC-like DNA-binding protein